MKLFYILYAILATINTVTGAENAIICSSSPEVKIKAGSVVSITINNPLGKSCEATVKFANSNSLPLHFGFKHINCPGVQLGQITIPLQAPNGDARILWKCANQTPSCSHLSISGGLQSIDTIPIVNYGEFSCVEAYTTSTLTSTSTVSSTTATATIASTYFTTSGALPASPTETRSTFDVAANPNGVTTDFPVTIASLFSTRGTTLITSYTEATATSVTTSTTTVTMCSASV